MIKHLGCFHVLAIINSAEVGPWVELGFGVGMKAFDELLLLNVP